MKKIILFSALSSLFFLLHSQNSCNQEFVCLFYNVENLFHPSKDSLKNDGDFTPEGFYHWGYKKYRKKIADIAKIIIAVNDTNPPSVIGLAEIENYLVLNDLCFYSPLERWNYNYITFESPDERGIDVALIYRKEKFSPLLYYPIPVVFPFDNKAKNRDILYVMGRLASGDTIHFFINHWTSRFGGYAVTIPKRNYYASTLKGKCDSLFANYYKPKIIIMGDFNDYYTDQSISDILEAQIFNNKNETGLINLMTHPSLKNQGSHKYEDFWGFLDQIIVSAFMLNDNKISIKESKAQLFNFPALLVNDEKYGGFKPNRTFVGFKYNGGYSDHLPVFCTICSNP